MTEKKPPAAARIAGATRSAGDDDQSQAGDEAAPAQVCEQLLAKTLSLQLATLGEDGYPHCGYTPYVMRQQAESGVRQFYIFVSELALHTRDLMREPRASILLIEDEADAKQIFARTRLYYECDVEELTREHASYTSILDAYEERQGKMVNLLRQLPDFRLMKLSPVSGQFVMGFGKAFKLTGPGLSEFEHSRRA